MSELELRIVLHLLVCVLSTLAGIVCWSTASRIRNGIGGREQGSPRLREWLLGTALIAAGLLLLAVILVSCILVSTIEPDPSGLNLLAALVLFLFLVVEAWIVCRAWRGAVQTFVVKGNMDTEDESVDTLASQGWQWGLSPFGLNAALIVISLPAILLLDSLGVNFNLNGRHSFAMTAVLIGDAAIVISSGGILFWLAAGFLKQPVGSLTPSARQSLAGIFRILSVCLFLVAAASLYWFGLVVAILTIIAAVSLAGGKYRTSQLTAFWVLANACHSRRPVAEELRSHAVNVRGRQRRWLLTAASQMQSGPEGMAALCRHKLIPPGCYLEVCSASDSGMLPAALQAAAARETERFARQGDPGAPRVFLGYIGAVGCVMGLIIGFIGYNIVPKFRKILEDFGVETNPLSSMVFHYVGNIEFVLLTFCGGLLCGLVGGVGELLVDMYGWHGVAERFGPGWSRRQRTPDLLRGLKWSILRQRPLEVALEAMARAPVGRSTRARLIQTANAIREGLDPWESLHQAQWITRPEVDLLQSAQTVGNLPLVLETLSDSQVARSEYRLESWLQVLHPLFIFGLASLVLLLWIGLFSPMVDVLYTNSAEPDLFVPQGQRQ